MSFLDDIPAEEWHKAQHKRFYGDKSLETYDHLEDEVKEPSHYSFLGEQVLDYIERELTPEEFKGYLKGNIMKYRLRAGKKHDTIKDINKALQYEEWLDNILQEEAALAAKLGEPNGLGL